MSTTDPKSRINIDEDVDDLDDVLDQFSPNPIPAPPPTATLGPSNAGRPRQNTRVAPPSLPDEVDLNEDFAKELAKGMETLMRELGEELPTGEDDEKKGVDFKARLKNALDNLKESESKLQEASGTGASPTPEPLEALFQSLNDGDPDDKGIESFLETMMGQLLSKEVLQEPLQELSDGFPGYLAKPPTPLSEDDRQRYVNQQACVSKILGVFNMPDYRDDHPAYPKEIVELMSELQSYGTPPSEIMGNLPPGFDTFDKFDEKDCHIS